MAGALYVFLSSTYFSIAVNSLSLGVIALCWVAIMVVHRRFLVSSTPLNYFFLAYAVAELVSLVLSVNQSQALLFSKRLLLIGIVYFLASEIRSLELAKRCVGILLGTAVLVSCYGVFKVVIADPVRLGIFQFYMTTSELMMMAALLIVPFAVHPNVPKAVRGAAIVGLIPVAISLYATVTRGAYLAVTAGILFIAFVRNKKLLIPFVVIVVCVLLFAPPYIGGRIRSIVDLNHPDNELRIFLWKTGLRIFADHPVFGVGDIDLHEIYLNYKEPNDPAQHGHLHNMLLQMLVTLGAVGFMAVVAMFVKIVMTEWRIYQRVKDDWFKGAFALGALAVFVGFQMSGLTEWIFGDQEVVTVFWTTVGMTLALSKLDSTGARGTTP